MTELLSAISKDSRYALRQLRRTPGFALVAVLTLALGIGANTAVFSVMNAVMLRYLPVPNPQQLVNLHLTDRPETRLGQTGHDDASLPEPLFEVLRTQKNVFSDLIAYVPLGINKIAVRYGDNPEEASADEVSGNFFSGLGVQIVRGRGFTVDEEKTHAQIAVLNYEYWTRRFGRNPSVLGQTIYIKGFPFAIIGIAAPDFLGLERSQSTDLWVPFQSNPNLKPWGASPQDEDSLYGAPGWFFLMMVGRLQPGVSEQQALAQINPIYHNVIREISTAKKDARMDNLHFTPARGIEGVKDEARKPLIVLMVMVGLVLLIACANVAMLLLARNAGRQREFSLRVALGAGRGVLFRQLLIESLLLVVAGGLLGWFFAVSATQVLAAWSQMDVSLEPDWIVLLFALAVCTIAALAFGLAPLRNVIRVPAGLALKTAAAASTQDRQKLRTGHVVVAAQISLCLMLLIGAGLLVRTLRNLENANLGLRASGLVVFGVAPPQGIHTDAEAVHFYQTLMDRLRTLPGVESGTLMGNRLGAGWSNNTTVWVDGTVPGGEKHAYMRWNAVGPDVFHVLDVPIVLGRDFTDADSPTAPKVAIINQTFAERYIAGLNPIGHRIALSSGPYDPQYTIVGVVADSKYTSVRETKRPMAYLPYTQWPGIGTMQVELRTRGNPEAVLPDARRIVHEFGPDLPLLQPITQQEQFAESFAQERLFARLSMFFGFLAALLVATGLYGTLAYRVSRRTAEIGVRMALGAQRSQVLWMILRESLLLSATGIVVGLPIAIASSRLLRSMLFGLNPGDPVTFAAALVGITLVVLAASAIPARRASSVDPMVALRYE
jgi:predicted permease